MFSHLEANFGHLEANFGHVAGKLDHLNQMVNLGHPKAYLSYLGDNLDYLEASLWVIVSVSVCAFSHLFYGILFDCNDSIDLNLQ